MLEFNKEEKGEINNFVTELNEIADKIDDANAGVANKVAELNELIQKYNNVLKNARDFRDGHVQRMSDYFNEKSESWQEGDAGSNYNTWMEEWENADLGLLALVEEPEMQDHQSAQAVLDELPTSPE